MIRIRLALNLMLNKKNEIPNGKRKTIEEAKNKK